MDSLRRRFLEVRAADDARNKLIEELLQQVDNMQKTMDRNAFTLVLIDGDGMNFLDDLVSKGIAGGSEASNRLRTNVFNELRYAPDFRHDEKILIKVYANIRGLSKLYIQNGLISSADDFADFVLGFNKAHPLCDFIDAGNHKESADKKLQETLDIHIYSPNSTFHDIDTARIRLIKGPPFALEFQSILPRYKQVEFTDVFRSEKISPSSGHRLPFMPKPQPRMGDDERKPINFFAEEPRSARAAPSQYSSPRRPPPPPEEYSSLPSRTSEVVRIDAFSSLSRAAPSPRLPRLGSGLGGGVSLLSTADSRPSDYDVEEALILSVLEQLAETPGSCDFGLIKRRAQDKLNVKSDFWGANEYDYWFTRSKRIIKWAVEEWMERTNSSPPGNATWLLKHFSSGGSPTQILRSPSAKAWRTTPDPTWILHFGSA